MSNQTSNFIKLKHKLNYNHDDLAGYRKNRSRHSLPPLLGTGPNLFNGQRIHTALATTIPVDTGPYVFESIEWMLSPSTHI